MESPQCFAIQLAETYGEDSNRATENQEIAALNRNCCGYCEVIAGRVDVYYWPDPKEDTSSWSIIVDDTIDVEEGPQTSIRFRQSHIVFTSFVFSQSK